LIFRGTFEYALDAKHRLTVPAKYRAAFASGVVLAASPASEADAPRTLSMWVPEAYDAYASSALAGLNPLSPKARDLKRVLYGMSWDLELDAANRLMVPGPALDFASLDKEVTVTGSGECLEIWDRASHATHNQVAVDRFPEIAASFDHTA
jgi:MraZ protein